MKTSLLLNSIRKHQGEVIAGWGDARLIRHPDGHHQLVGGTAADQAAARQWITLFAPDIVLTHHPLPSKVGAAEQPGRLLFSPPGRDHESG